MQESVPSPLRAAPGPSTASRHVAASALIDRIDALLPQTQCRRCGHDGCRPYAEAVAAGAPLNRCPPGGDAVIAALAALTRRPAESLDAACGAATPLQVARIDEAACIGCTLCIQACPVDALIGAPKRMHAVLSALCSGCGLCLPPCPVDCIALVPAGRAWSTEDARAARRRFEARNRRLAGAGPSTSSSLSASSRGNPDDPQRKRTRQAAVAAALARARARRAGRSQSPSTP